MAKPPRNKPGPPSAGRRAIASQLESAREGLRDLQEHDGNTGDFSVEHCSRMAKFWAAKFLQADQRYMEAADPVERRAAYSEMTAASREAGEWEKRKAGALASKKVDMLEEVLTRLNEQDQLASELLDIEE